MSPGDEIAGRYRLEELRGRGPMSEVWRAHDDRLDRTVALKVLSQTADLERFRREAQAAAALAHGNVMRVYDYGEDAAGPFMSLEWLDGGTLEDRLGDRPLPPAETARIARGMAAGLAHVHARGIVHRDLKPANVLFDEEGRPKLADLGLARSTSGAGTLTEAGTVLGTAAYMSPEQAGGNPALPASDVYSFGVILFRMLTGALPFAATDAFELLRLHRTVEAPTVEALNPEAPPALAALTAVALAKDPSARPADGEALLARLEDGAPVADETRVMAPLPVGPPEAAAGGRRRTAALAGLLLVLTLAGAALAWAVTRPSTAGSVRTSTGAVLGTNRSRSRRASTSSPVSTAPASAGTTTQSARTRTHPATTAAAQSTAQSTSPPPPPTTAVPPGTTTQTQATTQTTQSTTAQTTTQSTTATAATTTTAAPPGTTTTGTVP